MKLKSKREVTLKPLTYAQRMECEDIATVVDEGGKKYYEKLTAALSRWALYGLGLKDMEDLNRYSSAEIAEIGGIVSKEACKGSDPT